MIVTPATPSRLADYLVQEDGRLPLPLWRALSVQSACGPAWVFATAADAHPVAAAGIVHLATGSEAWFAVRPGSGGRMVGLVRAFRPLLTQEAQLVGRPIVTRVHVDNVAGLKLAALCGLSRVVDVDGDVAILGE